jgi:hypothetical protein
MKTFRLSSARVIAALAFIVVMLAILISARGAPIAGALEPMHTTHACAPSGAVSESIFSW